MKPIDYLNSLSFIRMGGSLEELKAAKMILGWLRELGYDAHLEKFDLSSFVPGDGHLTPLEPALQTIPVRPVGLSADADVEAEITILNIAEPEWAKAETLTNKIVFMSHYPRRKWLQLLVDSGAAAGIIVLQNHREESTIKLSQSLADDFGERIPLATITFKNAISLIRNDVRRARLSLAHKRFIATSQNVIAELAGRTERMILLTAHYDSTPCSPGAQDNAAGVAELLELARRFAKQNFVRRIRFLFCGSEEMGLVGSEFHASQHIDELDDIDLLINLDVGGDPFTPIYARTLGENDMVHYISGLLRQSGRAVKVEQATYSSDGMPFSKHGVPSVSLARSGVDGKGHSPFDSPENTCNRALIEIVDVAEIIVAAVADAKVLPFERKISGEMKTEIEKYFADRR